MNNTWNEAIGILQEMLEQMSAKGISGTYEQGKFAAIKACVEALRAARDVEFEAFDKAISRDFALDIAQAEEEARIRYNEIIMANDLQDAGTPAASLDGKEELH